MKGGTSVLPKVQVPFASGVPASRPIKEVSPWLLQSAPMVAMPGSGATLSNTVTVALSLAQGPWPSTLYLYGPGSEVPGM